MVQGYLREGLWRKAYLLEFYPNDKTLTPTNTFCFGVPPESEEIVLGMRKTETKTFGGVVIDDYGCDNYYKITLTGSSINNELRKIYSPINEGKYLTGEEEIYTFKKFLEDCKKRENLNGKILLYDLSKHSNSQEKKSLTDTFCWQVYPGEFKIKRSKEKPFTYTYSIEFTAIPQEKTKLFNNLVKVQEKTFLDTLDDLLQRIDARLFAVMRNARFKMVAETIGKINKLRGYIRDCKKFAKAVVTGTLNEIKQLAFSMIDIGNTAISLYHETIGDVVPFIMEMVDYVALMMCEIAEKSVDLYNNILSVTKKEFYIKTGDFSSLELYEEKMWGILSQAGNAVYKEAKTLSFIAKNILSNELEITIDENENKTQENEQEYETETDNAEDDDMSGSLITTKNIRKNKSETPTVIYGTKTELITDGMSFESLAVAYYGDASKAKLIASMNDASSIDEIILENRYEVIIPILEKSKTNFENKIIGFSTQRDNYGVDIYLDEKGNMSFNKTHTDLILVKGRENLSQAIINRLKENINKRIMQQYYGIRTTLPDDKVVGNAYILSSIIQTLKMESRIKELLSVSFKNDGDALRINIEYIDIGGNANNLQGVV